MLVVKLVLQAVVPCTAHVVLQDDSTTVASLTVPFAEGSVSKIRFISSYHDSSPDGPPGVLLSPWCGLWVAWSALYISKHHVLHDLHPQK